MNADLKLGVVQSALKKMIERPIIFKGAMAAAIQDGRKTQTRRIVSPQPPADCQVWGGWIMDSTSGKDVGKASWHDSDSPLVRKSHRVRCPYGRPGDRLWVRERMRVLDIAAPTGVQAIRVQYEADKATSDWIVWPDRLKGKPEVCRCLPYGGFREASRLTLEVTAVKVARLQDISEKDAEAEGISTSVVDPWPREPINAKQYGSARDAFADLWESIHGPGSLDANPWLWVLSFRRIVPAMGWKDAVAMAAALEPAPANGRMT